MFIKKNKIFSKNLFISFCSSSLKTIRRNTQGFTVIGVLVASAIGVIVVTGISQLFVNMSSQLKHVENRVKHTFFNEFIGSQLKTGCEETLQTHNVHILGGAGTDKKMQFTQIKNANGRVVADLDSEKDRLESEYGITGDAYFQLKCVGWDDDSNPSTPMLNDCDCSSTTPPFPCGRIWSLSLISQSKMNDVLVYSRGFSFELDINYTAPNTFTCNVTAAGVGTPISSGDCIYIDKSSDTALVGCGTTKDITNNTTTAYGFNAGSIGTGSQNTLIGYQAGENTSGTDNTFIGYQAGQANTSGTKNIFIGGNAGHSNTTGERNVFIGQEAGKNSTADYNFFLGSGAGVDTTTGASNVFLGNTTGTKNTTGSYNLFLGRSAGRDRTSGNDNVIIGAFAAAKSSGGDNNVFIGRNAGRTNSGNGNIFIGKTAGDNSSNTYSSVNNHFIVGNNTDIDWIVGDIGTYDVEINGEKICLENGTNCPTTASAGMPAHTHNPSSRTVKKNIKPFKSFKKALEDILKTPLFTYEYKKDHPEKSRMGIISEELPEHLQIKDKGKASQPDWPSIYGSFWAGIKALHEMIGELKNKLETLVKDFSQLKTELSNIKQELTATKKTNKNLSTENKKLLKEMADIKEKWNQTNVELKDIKTNFTKELSQFKTELSTIKEENKKLSKEITDTKEKLDQTNKELSKFKK